MTFGTWMVAAALAGASVPLAAQVALPGPQAISTADRQAGSKADPEMTAEYGGAYAGPQSALVRQVGARVARQSAIDQADRDFSFKLLNSGVPNAFAIPGGFVYTTRGLVALMNNEAELAFVLGHETGHIAARHSDSRQKVTQRNVLLGTLGQAVLGAVLGNGAAGQIGNQIGQAGIQRLVVGNVMSHSRQDEFQADDLGIAYAMKAGYDPTASADILGKLATQAALESRITGNTRTTPSWAMSHPDPAARVVRARQRTAQIGAKGGQRNADAFLLSLRGMVYGDDPAQGLVDGQAFRYPPGRIQFTAPAGYGMSNGSDAVTVSAAAGSRSGGQARFSGGRYDGDLAKVVTQSFAALSKNAAVSVQPTRATVNGMEAMTATLGATSNGQAVDLTVTAIAFSPTTAYTFVVLQPRGSGLGDLAGLIQSFRRMSDAEVAGIRPRVIDIVTVGRGDTVQSLSARMAFTDMQVDRFRVLNGLPAGATSLVPGSKVKLVVWGPPQKY